MTCCGRPGWRPNESFLKTVRNKCFLLFLRDICCSLMSSLALEIDLILQLLLSAAGTCSMLSDIVKGQSIPIRWMLTPRPSASASANTGATASRPPDTLLWFKSDRSISTRSCQVSLRANASLSERNLTLDNASKSTGRPSCEPHGSRVSLLRKPLRPRTTLLHQ